MDDAQMANQFASQMQQPPEPDDVRFSAKLTRHEFGPGFYRTEGNKVASFDRIVLFTPEGADTRMRKATPDEAKGMEMVMHKRGGLSKPMVFNTERVMVFADENRPPEAYDGGFFLYLSTDEHHERPDRMFPAALAYAIFGREHIERDETSPTPEYGKVFALAIGMASLSPDEAARRIENVLHEEAFRKINEDHPEVKSVDSMMLDPGSEFVVVAATVFDGETATITALPNGGQMIKVHERFTVFHEPGTGPDVEPMSPAAIEQLREAAGGFEGEFSMRFPNAAIMEVVNALAFSFVSAKHISVLVSPKVKARTEGAWIPKNLADRLGYKNTLGFRHGEPDRESMNEARKLIDVRVR